jgi:hypothetical protein
MSDLTNCNTCGSPINNEDIYCPKCGTKLQNAEKEKDQVSNGPENFLKNFPFALTLTSLISFIFLLILKIPFLFVLFIEIAFFSFFCIKYPKFLNKFHSVPDVIKVISNYKKSLRGKFIVTGILIVELLLLFLSVITSDFYHRYAFQNKVNELVSTSNTKAIEDYYSEIIETECEDSLYILISKSIGLPTKPLSLQIQKDFGNYSSNLQEKVVNLFKSKNLQVFKPDSIATLLIQSKFIPPPYVQMAMKTHDTSVLLMVSSNMLKSIVKECENFTPEEIIAHKIKFSQVNDLFMTINNFRAFFRPKEDTLWSDIQKYIWEFDTLRGYFNHLKTDLPEKPRLERCTFSGPTSLSGAVIPYDGEGLCVTDGSKFYIITGVSKDPVGYFDGYVNITDETESIYSKNNGSTWDATICEYVSPQEYNDAVKRFHQDQKDAQVKYAKDLRDYKQEMANYNNFIKSAPIIKSYIINLIGFIKTTLTKIKGI